MRPMRHRIVIVSLLGLSLFGLTALAHASPPDETWQSGIYDDGDFDDVIALILSLSGSAPELPSDSVPDVPVAREIVLTVKPDNLPIRLILPDVSRSPPPS